MYTIKSKTIPQGGDVLVFKMEIIEVMGEGVPAVKCNPWTGDECSDKEKKYAEKWKASFIPFKKESLKCVNKYGLVDWSDASHGDERHA